MLAFLFLGWLQGHLNKADDLKGPLDGPVDRILIDKSDRRMTAFRGGKPVRIYDIALGFAPKGDKKLEGDGKTPEGVFRVDLLKKDSNFHLALRLDYPRADHIALARAGGYDPGGDIFIHGQPNSRPDGEILPGDWTAGCIALSDAEVTELFGAIRLGTEVEIQP